MESGGVRLRVYLDGEKEDSDEFNLLLNELEVAGELRKQAQENLDAAIDAHTEAKQLVKTAKEELSQAPEIPKPTDKQLRTILAKSVSDVFTGKTQALSSLLK